MAVTYYVVVPFLKDPEGNPVPGEAKEAPSSDSARRRARNFGSIPGACGAIAFSRTGDPEMGEFQDAVILEAVGFVDTTAVEG